jgi:hypothetical protein
VGGNRSFAGTCPDDEEVAPLQRQIVYPPLIVMSSWGACSETSDLTEPRFSDPWPDALQDDVLQDRDVDRPLVHYLLDLVEDRRAFPAVEFDRLLLGEHRCRDSCHRLGRRL